MYHLYEKNGNTEITNYMETTKSVNITVSNKGFETNKR